MEKKAKPTKTASKQKNQPEPTPPPLVVEVVSPTFDSVVKNSKLPVVVDFFAPWCGPCRMLHPVFDEVAKELQGKVKFVRVNIDESREIAASYGIMSVPTLVFFKGGSDVGMAVGFMTAEQLKAKICEVFGLE